MSSQEIIKEGELLLENNCSPFYRSFDLSEGRKVRATESTAPLDKGGTP